MTGLENVRISRWCLVDDALKLDDRGLHMKTSGGTIRTTTKNLSAPPAVGNSTFISIHLCLIAYESSATADT